MHGTTRLIVKRVLGLPGVTGDRGALLLAALLAHEHCHPLLMSRLCRQWIRVCEHKPYPKLHAGCLPTLATIPVFWGLYRTLSNASSDGALTGGFYWLPDLAGPTSLAAQKAGA